MSNFLDHYALTEANQQNQSFFFNRFFFTVNHRRTDGLIRLSWNHILEVFRNEILLAWQKT